jgi:spermidine synthase
MYSAALQLKQQPRVLVIGAGGGVDVWAAFLRNPVSVRAIELNRQILDIQRHELPHYSRPLLEDPRIEFVHGEGRSELMRDSDRYDVIQMSGIDTWTALSSGAYVLAENYLYTREAFETLYRHLDLDGLLQIIRPAAEMETLRLLSNIHAALQSLGVQDFERSVIVLRTSDGVAAVLVKRGIFSPAELDQMTRFAMRAEIERVYVPAEIQDGVIPAFVRSSNKEALIERFPRDISPTTDDRPYFFNFTKWKNPFSSVKYLPEPTNVSQGNPAFLLGQLVLSIVASAVLILLPLFLIHRQAANRAHFKTFLVYFMGLGIGFITIEISLMQKLTLFLGHPMYSITVTLFSILVFTGLGSLLSESFFRAGQVRIWPVPLVLVALLGSFLWLSPLLFREFIGEPIVGRAAIAVGLLAPIGLALGVPFAYGIRLVNRFNPTIIPWAWAVNACCTVIGSVATVILSMNFGFRFVMIAALVIYAAAFATLRRLPA